MSGLLRCALRHWATVFLSFTLGILMTLTTLAAVGRLGDVSLPVAAAFTALSLAAAFALIYTLVRLGLMTCRT